MAKSAAPQSFEHHAKWVPGYHMVTTAFVLVFTVWAAFRMFDEPSLDTAALMAAALALNLVGFYARSFATQNQDRIIRLEERLRMGALLPTDLQARINDLTTSQLVALRFASDEELPALARKVLEESIGDRKAIKQLIHTWRADHQRV